MKTISKDGKLWFRTNANGHVEVGFTGEFLGELDGCWHMLPAAGQKTEIKEQQPLVAVETNDGLFSLPSPVSGIITFFDNKAMNFPEKLDTDQVVCVVKDAEAIRAEEKRIREEHEAAVQRLMAQQEQRNAQAQIRNQPAVQPGIRIGNRPNMFFDDLVAAQPVAPAPRRNGGRQ